jgi:Rrf2 family protein
MKLSRKSDYALRALLTLGERFGQGPISIRELAELNDIPQRFLEQIMLDMKKVGWVTSIAGRIGGFQLATAPENITMGQVVRHFDGVLAPISCVSTTHYEPCSQEWKCRFRRVLLESRNFTVQLMEKATLAKVLQGAPVQREEVFANFAFGDGI